MRCISIVWGKFLFEIGVFSNLTQDHLDYHHTMEEYYKAKRMLFQMTKKSNPERG